MSESADLDQRRAWAHKRAIVSIVAAVVVRAVHAAGAVLVALSAAARLTSLVAGHGFRDSPVWAAGPAGVACGAVLASALTALFFARAVLRGAGEWLLHGLPASAPQGGPPPVVANVVEALALGQGVEVPEVRVIDDPAPNAISARMGGKPVLVVTTGLAELPRDELEAVCAHELVQLNSPDARLFSAAFMAMVRARKSSIVIGAAGFLVAGAAMWAAAELSVFLPSVFAVGAVLTVFSMVAIGVLTWLLESLRRAVDDVADVGAVLLARHPEALAAVLDRLRQDERRVAVTTDRCEWLWFEAVEEATAKMTRTEQNTAEATAARRLVAKAAKANVKIDEELGRRAELARATAAGLSPAPEAKLD